MKRFFPRRRFTETRDLGTQTLQGRVVAEDSVSETYELQTPYEVRAEDSQHHITCDLERMEGEGEELEMSFSSDAAVRVMGVDEILSHEDGDYSFNRLVEVGSILKNHDPSRIVGTPTGVRVTGRAGNRKGRVKFRFGTTEEAQQAQTEVVTDKSLRGVSVGYRVGQYQIFREDGTYKGRKVRAGTWVAVRWEATEASLTPIPADPSVGVNRSIHRQQEEEPMKKWIKLLRALGSLKAGSTIQVSEEKARDLVDGDEPAGQVIKEPTGMYRTEATELDGETVQVLQVEEREQSAPEQPANLVTMTREDFNQAVQQGVQGAFTQETERRNAIEQIGAQFGVDVSQALREGWDVARTNQHVLTQLGEGNARGPSITISNDERADQSERTAHALRQRAGCKLTDEEREQVRGSEVAHMSLMELAKESYRRLYGHVRGTTDEIITAVLQGPSLRAGESIAVGTSDFPNILANVAGKELLVGSSLAATTFREWCKIGTGPDFKSMTRVKLSQAGKLEVVPELAGYNDTKFGEQKESIQIATYGKTFGISRQAIINDDLSAFTDIPRAMGRAASVLPNDLAVTVLLANGNMEDGVALFATGHANNNAAAGGQINDTLAKARVGIRKTFELLMKQTAFQHADVASGEQLSLRLMPHVVLVPPDGYFNALEVLRATRVEDHSATGSDFNPLAGMARVVMEPSLQDSNLTGNSATAHYTFADPMQAPVIEVAFLNGVETPYLEETPNTGRAADGIIYKVRLDCGAAAVDWKGATREEGA